MTEQPLTGNPFVRKTGEQVSVDIKEETVILHLKSGVYFGLDPVGTFIWNFIQEKKAVTEIMEAILEEFDVGPERGKSDIMTFIKELSKEGLIEVEDAAPV